MRLAAPLAVGLSLLAAGSLTACRSTRATSAMLGANGDKLLKQKTLSINQQSSDIKVVSTTLLPGTDPTTSTVVVELHNDSDQGFINIPIQIDVRDAKGKTVFKNDAAGTDPTLVSVPVVQPGADVWWVHDQVFAIGGKPASVKVEVGQSQSSLPDLPEVSVSDPKVIKDSISGLDEANGTVENKAGEELHKVYIYVVGTKGNKIVTAGRGAIDKLKLEPKTPPEYHVFLAGDPNGADLSVYPTPTFLDQ